MADDPNKLRSDDSVHDLDDDELIAYLDGELDPDEANEIEEKLAHDPKAKARAAEYKKTYDLLEYLPKSEPSPEFATRTITRLQPTLATPNAPSSSQPVMMPTSAMMLPSARRSLWPELLAWSLACALACGIGYAAHYMARPYLSPPVEAEKIDQADLPIVHELPYYLGVDDLDFLRKLRDQDLFDGNELMAEKVTTSSGSQREKVSLEHQQKLISIFLSLPEARRKQLRTLHQQLKDLPAKEREGLRTTLEEYAVWLDRLADADRKEVLAANSPEARLETIKQILERRWRESLSLGQKQKLSRTASAEERVQLAREFHEQEQNRKREWELAKRQWQPNKGDDLKPWPFNDPNLPKQIDVYLVQVLGVDLTKKDFPMPKKGDKLDLTPPAPCRLTREELTELKIKYDAAVTEGYWGVYAECLYRLSERHPSLPKPQTSPIINPSQISLTVTKLLPKDTALGKRLRMEQTIGRWPDFALYIAEHAKPPKGTEPIPALGPCKIGSFQEDVNKFFVDTLFPKLSQSEKDQLKSNEGKWPEYPRMLMDLSKTKNLSVPGVSLPGEPERWANYYRLAPKK